MNRLNPLILFFFMLFQSSFIVACSDSEPVCDLQACTDNCQAVGFENGICQHGTCHCQGSPDSGLDSDQDSDTLPDAEADSDTDTQPDSEADEDSDECQGLDRTDDDEDGYSECEGDCNDDNAQIHPGAAEVCDGIDNDCNAGTDENIDDDDDEYSECEGDCNDGNDEIHPGINEIPLDEIDQNCDGFDYCTDLNCDGLTDIVFANAVDNLKGGGTTTDIISYIYWGFLQEGELRFGEEHRQELPTLNAQSVKIVDIDGNGYLDLVFAQHSIPGNYCIDSRIYFGDETFFESPQPWPGEEDVGTFVNCFAHDLCIEDFDADGLLDIVSANSHNTSNIFWNIHSGADFSLDYEVLGGWAKTYGCAVGDIDGDGDLDVFLPHNYHPDYGSDINSTLLRQDHPIEGYPEFNLFMEIPTHSATDAKIADLDGDTHQDLIISNYYFEDDGEYETHSYILWGPTPYEISGDRYTGILGLGAYDISIFDVDGDDLLDIVFANQTDDGSNTYVDSYVYYNDDARFDSPERAELPTIYPFDSFVGDLDGDSNVDIIFATNKNGGLYGTESFIYWGSGTRNGFGTTPGFGPGNRTGLPTVGAAGVSAAGPGIPVQRSIIP